MTYWILDEHNDPCPATRSEWAVWFEGNDRLVDRTELHTPVGVVVISTVFLGIDHGFGRGRPVLFESMTFGGVNDGEQDRYCTWDRAVAGHKRMVAASTVRPVEASSQEP